MRIPSGMPKLACSFLLLPAVLVVAAITGCGPDANSPDVKKKIQENAAVIKDADAADNASAKSAPGKKTAVMKSIKGRLGGGAD